MKEYRLLAENDQLDSLRTALEKYKEKENLFSYLVVARKVDLIIALGEKRYLRQFEEGRKKLFELRDWYTIFEYPSRYIHEYYGFKTSEEFYQYVSEHGGSEQVLLSGCEIGIRYLLKHKITEPFVKYKYWSYLAHYGFYDLVDCDDYWQKSLDKKYVIQLAIKAKKWDFLEKKGCRQALFKHFRWCRLYRLLRK